MSKKSKERKNSKYPKQIGRRLLIGTSIFMVIMGLAAGVLNIYQSQKEMMDDYRRDMQAILDISKNEIDGDDLARCIETGKPSEQYYESRDKLDAYLENFPDAEYLYVIKPMNTNPEDNIMSVMNGARKERIAREENAHQELGSYSGGSYPQKIAVKCMKYFKTGKKIYYFPNNTDFGWEYTALDIIRDSKGNPVALIGIDISLKEIVHVVIGEAIVTIFVTIILIILVQLILYKWLQKKVVFPMKRLEASATGLVESQQNASHPSELRYEDPNIHTQDEMESLADTMQLVSDEMKEYMGNLLAEAKKSEKTAA